jgi:hypothetical protein
MANEPRPNASSTILMAAILVGAVIIAVVGTFLPDLIGIEGTPALVLRLVFYVVAAVDVAVAFWLRGRLRHAQARGVGGTTRHQSGPVERQ